MEASLYERKCIHFSLVKRISFFQQFSRTYIERPEAIGSCFLNIRKQITLVVS